MVDVPVQPAIRPPGGTRAATALLAFAISVATAGVGRAAPPIPSPITRGPYLQVATPTGVTVRWRTETATDARVWIGPAPGTLSIAAGHDEPRTEHAVALTGLAPATRYHYAVGTSAGVLDGDDADTWFETAPASGPPAPTRIWVIGDSGTGDRWARMVCDSYRAFTGARATDVWLTLGDNAYPGGSDADYQSAFFDQYPELLRTTPVWPTRGNHDLVLDGILPDYDEIFTLPEDGEAGGVSSHTNRWYAFDRANIHFVSLDTEDGDLSSGGPMLSWLADDLAANDSEWTIAFFHHPPYTSGSHDSDDDLDSGGRLHDVRVNALPILEAAGVDLVLAGHSHSYERSLLLGGHYGHSETLTPEMTIDPGDGRLGGDGPYVKTLGAGGPGAGAVFAVVGCSGDIIHTTFGHPVMVSSLLEMGSLVVDVDGFTLHARFLDRDGAVRDSFTIVKQAPAAAGPRRAATLALAPVVPNPAHAGARFAWTLPQAMDLRLEVLDVSGRRVRTLADGAHGAGRHEAIWDGRDARGAAVPAGVYLARIEGGDRSITRRFALVR